MMGVQVRSARPVDLPGIAAVLQDAFSDKMRIIFGKQPDKTHRLLEALYSGPLRRGYDGVLVAERDGRILGALVMEPMRHTPEEHRAFEQAAVRELGLPRMAWASFLLWLFSHDPAPDEAYVSDLGVASDVQGQGVGTLLMQYAEQWAYERGFARLTLWVAGTNDRAIHVYEKAGLVVVRTRSSLLTRLFFDIKQWYFMEKQFE